MGSVSRGISSSASPTVIVPHGLRSDPAAMVPAELADMEVHRGLMHLVQVRLGHRGQVRVTGGSGFRFQKPACD